MTREAKLIVNRGEETCTYLTIMKEKNMLSAKERNILIAAGNLARKFGENFSKEVMLS